MPRYVVRGCVLLSESEQKRRSHWSKLSLIDARIVRMIAGPEMSNALALRYNLTCKAVRDIWNMRTWQKVTCKHWTLQEQHKALGIPLSVYPLSYQSVVLPYMYAPIACAREKSPHLASKRTDCFSLSLQKMI